ncbi:MAG TPA: XRE family transcriptional regulator [Candidatus Binatia bacterium]|nr:XRE family transcriptional regulator [Candidatus Binatia bacterium]
MPLKRAYHHGTADQKSHERAAENSRCRSHAGPPHEQPRRGRALSTAAAKLMGVTQPSISDLVRGKIELFSIDMLVETLSRVGAIVPVAVRTSKTSSITIASAAGVKPHAFPLILLPARCMRCCGATRSR